MKPEKILITKNQDWPNLYFIFIPQKEKNKGTIKYQEIPVKITKNNHVILLDKRSAPLTGVAKETVKRFHRLEKKKTHDIK